MGDDDDDEHDTRAALSLPFNCCVYCCSDNDDEQFKFPPNFYVSFSLSHSLDDVWIPKQ